MITAEQFKAKQAKMLEDKIAKKKELAHAIAETILEQVLNKVEPNRNNLLFTWPNREIAESVYDELVDEFENRGFNLDEEGPLMKLMW